MSPLTQLFLAASVAWLAPQQTPTALVSTVQHEQDWFCSISAPRMPLDSIVQQLARGMNVQVEGLDLISPTALVTVELRERPAEQALEWMLGAVGLRATWRTGVIEIRAVAPSSPTPEELRECALASYSAALRSFPDADAGAAAAFAKASIYESRGDIEQALASFDSLVRAFPQSDQAAEALIRAARRLFARKDYAAACAHYADLLRLPRSNTFGIEARLGLANCMARLGQHRQSLLSLAALETSAPPATRLDLHQRLLIRARCLIAEENAAGARKLLAEAENGGLEEELEPEFYELTARALPADAPPEYAATAWMELARRCDGALRAEAVGEAARLTRLAGDELGALWIDRWALQNGVSDATNEHARAARESLGLEVDSLGTDPGKDRLARAERLMHARLWAEGHSAFLAVRESAPLLDDAGRTRLYVGIAACLDGLDRVDDAIAMLREGLEQVKDAERRREFYVTAAAIYEAHQRVDDAIEAYRGRL